MDIESTTSAWSDQFAKLAELNLQTNLVGIEAAGSVMKAQVDCAVKCVEATLMYQGALPSLDPGVVQDANDQYLETLSGAGETLFDKAIQSSDAVLERYAELWDEYAELLNTATAGVTELVAA